GEVHRDTECRSCRLQDLANPDEVVSHGGWAGAFVSSFGGVLQVVRDREVGGSLRCDGVATKSVEIGFLGPAPVRRRFDLGDVPVDEFFQGMAHAQWLATGALLIEL